jgi:hypothetical protein
LFTSQPAKAIVRARKLHVEIAEREPRKLLLHRDDVVRVIRGDEKVEVDALAGSRLRGEPELDVGEYKLDRRKLGGQAATLELLVGAQGEVVSDAQRSRLGHSQFDCSQERIPVAAELIVHQRPGGVDMRVPT